MTVHHLENSRSQRVLWLLEELGLDYKIRRYPRDPQTMLAPAELRAVHPLGKSPVIFKRIETAPMPFFVRPVARGIAAKVLAGFVDPNLRSQLDFMEAELGRSEWFAGAQFSAADIQMSFPLEAARQRAGLDASRPRLHAFLQRIHARPAYRRALERGGPYNFAAGD